MDSDEIVVRTKCLKALKDASAGHFARDRSDAELREIVAIVLNTADVERRLIERAGGSGT